jgi:hypothetical protein
MLNAKIVQWIQSAGVGSLKINKGQGGMSSLNACDCHLASNEGDLLDCISRSLPMDFDAIVIKRRKVGYAIQVERTVRV